MVELDPFKDERGLFARTFCKNEFTKINHSKEFVQINHSVIVQKGSMNNSNIFEIGEESLLYLSLKLKSIKLVFDVIPNSLLLLYQFIVMSGLSPRKSSKKFVFWKTLSK